MVLLMARRHDCANDLRQTVLFQEKAKRVFTGVVFGFRDIFTLKSALKPGHWENEAGFEYNDITANLLLAPEKPKPDYKNFPYNVKLDKWRGFTINQGRDGGKIPGLFSGGAAAGG